MLVLVKWDAERRVFVPRSNYISQLLKLLQHGKELWLEQVTMRSIKEHKRFFVHFGERWDSMPAHICNRFVAPTHFRKFCLVKCGWFETMVDHPFPTQEGAVMGASCAKIADAYSVVVINDCVVTVCRARSMQMTGDRIKMTTKEFQQAARDVLAFCDEILKINREEAEQFKEIEDIGFEAQVRLGKAHRE